VDSRSTGSWAVWVGAVKALCPEEGGSTVTQNRERAGARQIVTLRQAAPERSDMHQIGPEAWSGGAGFDSGTGAFNPPPGCGDSALPRP
jgi:hypothetical protein